MSLYVSFWAKAALGETWTRIADAAGRPLVDGNRIGILTPDRTLIAKEGVNGTWFTLASNVDDVAGLMLTPFEPGVPVGVAGDAAASVSWLAIDTINGGTVRNTCDSGPDTDTATTCETKLNIP